MIAPFRVSLSFSLQYSLGEIEVRASGSNGEQWCNNERRRGCLKFDQVTCKQKITEDLKLNPVVHHR